MKRGKIYQTYGSEGSPAQGNRPKDLFCDWDLIVFENVPGGMVTLGLTDKRRELIFSYCNFQYHLLYFRSGEKHE